MQTEQIEVFENDIELYLKMYCEQYEIDDIKAASQSVWNGALRYIQKHVFNNRDIFKSKTNISNDNSIMDSTYNAYNYDLVDNICNIYIDLCFIYDKEISIMGFSNLTGINNILIQEWGNNTKKLSSKSFEIYQKLCTFREESLSDKLATGNKNPVGILAILNRHYAWNLPGVSREKANASALPDTELPKLPNYSSNCTTEKPLLNCTKDG